METFLRNLLPDTLHAMLVDILATHYILTVACEFPDGVRPAVHDGRRKGQYLPAKFFITNETSHLHLKIKSKLLLSSTKIMIAST